MIECLLCAVKLQTCGFECVCESRWCVGGGGANPELDGRSFLGVLGGKAKDWMQAQGDKGINNPPVEID